MKYSVNPELVRQYNRVFGTNLCPEQKYSNHTLYIMRKKLNSL